MFRGLPEIPVSRPVRPRPATLATSGEAQRALCNFNRERLAPGLGERTIADQQMMVLEHQYVESARAESPPLRAEVPTDPAKFVAWFEALNDDGPGQGDP